MRFSRARDQLFSRQGAGFAWPWAMYMSPPATADPMRHSVRTLGRADFDAACASLMRMVAASYSPTLLIGIRTGGLVVAESMARAAAASLPVLPLTCQRAGTATKSRLPFLHQLLAVLPRGVVDALRLLEHRLLSPRRKRLAKKPNVDHAEATAIGAQLATTHSQHRLLVVDDAVDSGVTLETVVGLLRSSCPADTDIRSAVITVTLEAPRAEPDYALYRGVLCRFPWSFDAAR
jgi:hypoxanthine phosphoribosyltransferase